MLDFKKKIISKTKGRVLFVDRDATLYISKGYVIYKSGDFGKSWNVECDFSLDFTRSQAAYSNIISRLLRLQITSLIVLPNKNKIAVAKEGIFLVKENGKSVSKTFKIVRGSRPINISADDNGRVLFGEYGNNKDRHEIFIYVSEDYGESFYPALEFKAGEIRHVHNIIYDDLLRKYWVFVGDYMHEPGIGILDYDFSHIEWVVRGSQTARAVGVILGKDYLVYGTDTEIEQNYIVRLDKTTGKLTRLLKLEGSSLYAGRYGSVSIISTCVEPSKVNRLKHAFLYCSNNDEDWHKMDEFRKDLLPGNLFQYGTVVLPQSRLKEAKLMYSGQALSNFDNKIQVVSFE